MFGLSGEKVFQDAGTLSGGEKTKLALAQLVAGRHNVLLLDEPTNNLDPASRTATGEALAAWPGTMIVVSHDTEFVKSFAPDRALLMPDATLDYFDDEMLELARAGLIRLSPGSLGSRTGVTDDRRLRLHRRTPRVPDVRRRRGGRRRRRRMPRGLHEPVQHRPACASRSSCRRPTTRTSSPAQADVVVVHRLRADQHAIAEHFGGTSATRRSQQAHAAATGRRARVARR